MTDRDPYRDDDIRDMRARRLSSDPTVRASPQRAIWSWIAGLAIVFILFVVFYGISQRDTKTALTIPNSPAVNTPSTTGQGSKMGNSGSGPAAGQNEPLPATPNGR
jgi:hypothetical protein